MSWDYRVLETKFHPHGKPVYEIVEVNYDDNGFIESFTEIGVYGETLGDVTRNLNKLVEAMQKPILQEATIIGSK